MTIISIHNQNIPEHVIKMTPPVTLILEGQPLTLEDVVNVSRNYMKVVLSEKIEAKLKSSRAVLERALQRGEKVYGVTTGFGKLVDIKISVEENEKLQINLIRSHSAGVGEYLPEDVVRAMILLRIQSLLHGYSAVRKIVLEYLIELLNAKIYPLIPSKGSLGASGDLAPLAHVALILIGEGKAKVNNEVLEGMDILRFLGREPLQLKAKEGLALINGTQAMTAIGALAIWDALYLLKLSNYAAALTLQARKGIINAFDPIIAETRPYQGLKETIDEMNHLLKGSRLTKRTTATQDPYSIRCVPQAHGAVKDALNYVMEKIQVELNAVTDNPLIVSKNGEDIIISGGNFHGDPLALLYDYIGIALTKLGAISERRVEQLLNPSLSKLPAFLTPNSGLHSGLMIAQYTSAALTSENRILATPASIDNIPVSANQEDYVSMGMTAALKLQKIVNNLKYIITVELIAACQAIDLQQAATLLSPMTKRMYEKIRAVLPKLDEDRVLARDIQKIVELINKRVL